VGGVGFGLRCGKTQSQEHAPKARRVPTRPLHALLGALSARQPPSLKTNTQPILQNCTQITYFRNHQKRAQRTRSIAKQIPDPVKNQLKNQFCEGKP